MAYNTDNETGSNRENTFNCYRFLFNRYIFLDNTGTGSANSKTLFFAQFWNRFL